MNWKLLASITLSTVIFVSILSAANGDIEGSQLIARQIDETWIRCIANGENTPTLFLSDFSIVAIPDGIVVVQTDCDTTDYSHTSKIAVYSNKCVLITEWELPDGITAVRFNQGGAQNIIRPYLMKSHNGGIALIAQQEEGDSNCLFIEYSLDGDIVNSIALDWVFELGRTHNGYYIGGTDVIYALDCSGRLMWKKNIDNTIFDITSDGSSSIYAIGYRDERSSGWNVYKYRLNNGSLEFQIEANYDDQVPVQIELTDMHDSLVIIAKEAYWDFSVNDMYDYNHAYDIDAISGEVRQAVNIQNLLPEIYTTEYGQCTYILGGTLFRDDRIIEISYPIDFISEWNESLSEIDESLSEHRDFLFQQSFYIEGISIDGTNQYLLIREGGDTGSVYIARVDQDGNIENYIR